MSITFPTFIDKEIPSPEKFNDFVQALEAKFTSGIGSAEIQWPLIAGGNLVMGDYEITGATKLLKVVNAAQYSTFAAALVAGAGGCIFVPPNTTIDVDGSEAAGTSLTIVGAGPTSVLRLQSGASAGWLLRNTSASASISLSNLTLDGNDEGSNDGLVVRAGHDCMLACVWFKNFGGSALKLTALSGAPCRNVQVLGNKFKSGAGHHIEMDDVTDINIDTNYFYDAESTVVQGVPADANAQMERINVANNIFNANEAGLVNIVGGGGSWDAKWSSISVTDNIIYSTAMAAGSGIIVGDTAAWVQSVNVSDNIAPGMFADGIKMFARYGNVIGNMMRGAGGDGIDLLSSEDLVVANNNCRDATTYGIDFSSTVDCNIHDNECSDSGTDINFGTSTSQHYGNSDSIAETPPINTYYSDAGVITIPANTLKVGDSIHAAASIVDDAAGTQTMRFQGETATSITASGASADIYHMADIFVDASTTAKSIYLCAKEGTSPSIGQRSLTGLDLTAAVLIDITGALGGTVAYGMTVTIKRGIEQ